MPSLPSRERGLKYNIANSVIIFDESLPSWERGLKLSLSHRLFNLFWSLPLRESGLKCRVPVIKSRQLTWFYLSTSVLISLAALRFETQGQTFPVCVVRSQYQNLESIP